MRGEGVDTLWEKIEEHRAWLEAEGELEERRAGTSRREVFQVASARARRHLEDAVQEDPELRRLLEDVQARRLDPLTAVREILERCSGLAHDDGTRRSLTSRPRASGSPAVARVTPVYGSETLSRLTGGRVWLKAENLQRTGSFKIRGAVNKLATLDDAERAAGVIAASAGNHGQAVAWAARELGIAATVFMPQDAPMAKVEATQSYGAETVLAGAGFDDALAAAHARAEETGATFVHAFEDPLVIAGQGTLGLELVDQVPDATTFLLPIGGGGLAAGIATVAARAAARRAASSACRRARPAAARSPTASP